MSLKCTASSKAKSSYVSRTGKSKLLFCSLLFVDVYLFSQGLWWWKTEVPSKTKLTEIKETYYCFTFSHWQFSVLFVPVMLLGWADEPLQGRPGPQIGWSCYSFKLYFLQTFVWGRVSELNSFCLPLCPSVCSNFWKIEVKNLICFYQLYLHWWDSTESSEGAFI